MFFFKLDFNEFTKKNMRLYMYVVNWFITQTKMLLAKTDTKKNIEEKNTTAQ